MDAFLRTFRRVTTPFVVVVALILLGEPVFAQNGQLPALAETKKKAEAGDAPAQFDLGRRYDSSLDFVTAADWYRRAAVQGHLGAQMHLGSMLLRGKPSIGSGKRGVPKNELEGVGWLTKAANGGEKQAMHELGRCYLSGTGVAADRLEAYKWLKLASADGSAIIAKVELDQLILKLSNGEIATGQKRVDAFKVASASKESPSDWLKLQGIVGSDTKRLALVNGKTLEAGESATFSRVTGERVVGRCLEVGTNFVRLQIGDQPEVRLRLTE